MGKVIMSGIVSELTAPVSGTPLSTYAEGSIVKINEYGNPVEFFVGKHDYESELNGTGRTLLVRKNCYYSNATTGQPLVRWSDSGENQYASSTLSIRLNNTSTGYPQGISSTLWAKIPTTKYRIIEGGGSNTVITDEAKIFALSLTELGKTHTYATVLGTALSIADKLQAVYLDDSLKTGGTTTRVVQWTRTAENSDAETAYAIDDDGTVARRSTAQYQGARPCFTLPSTTKINKNGQVIE